jgi:hypothetical protein
MYRPVAILIERAANGHALISQLGRRFPKLAKLVIPIKPEGRSKSARLRVHAETIIAGRIHLAADSWRDEFISEFIEFPHGHFSDQVDATTQFLDHADELAAMKSSPEGGLAAAGFNSSGRTITIARSKSGERGLIAGVHSDGRPITPLPGFKVWKKC